MTAQRFTFKINYETRTRDTFCTPKSESEAIACAKSKYPNATRFEAVPPFVNENGITVTGWDVYVFTPAHQTRIVDAWDKEDAVARFNKTEAPYWEKTPHYNIEIVKSELLPSVPLSMIHDSYRSFGWSNAGFTDEQQALIKKARDEKALREVSTSQTGNSYEVISDKYQFYYSVDCS